MLEAEQLRNRGERTLETYYDDLVANTPEVAELFARAGRSTQVYPAADFSYRMREFGGDGWVSVGDAAPSRPGLFLRRAHCTAGG